MQITAPASMHVHLQKIFRGEYDVPYQFSEGSQSPHVILDIGANVGGFAAWASQRWPDSRIICYEPLSSNFSLLMNNMSSLPNVVAINRAVGDPTLTKLFLGRNNCGENSFFDLGEQTTEFEEVVTIHPEELPPAAILKIDTEGSEMDILSRLPAIKFDVILLEYHAERDRRRIDALLKDYCLVGGEARSAHRGTLKYLHKSLVA